jgi:hypothetical protein
MYHSLALTSDGQVFTWGYNLFGQLGNNSTTQSNVPVVVNTSGALAGKTVVAIAAGMYHSLALTSDGQVFAWGYNLFGQLGNNSTTQSNVPVAVNTSGALAGKTVVAIAGGGYHGLALTSDKQIFDWGYNVDGQLGNNSATQSNVPAAVTSGTGALPSNTAVAVAAGMYHSLAMFGSVPPSVTGNPVNQTVASGTTVNFTAAATGTPAPTVQWQVSTTGTAGPFSNITGNATATSGTLTLTNVTFAQNGSAYQAVFTNIAGSCTTTAATLTVNPPAPVITSALSATGTNGVAFSYQIVATNSPTSYGASVLPAGLNVDPVAGLVSGTPTQNGTFNSTISAANAGGTGSAALAITVLPPPPVITTVLGTILFI